MKKLKTVLFWIVSVTWGFPTTFIGALVTLGLLMTGHRPKIFHHSIYFVVGKHWGGVNFGAFFLTDSNENMRTKQHESGHGIQNIIFGWLMPFCVGIPSTTRYWYREIIRKRNPEKYKQLKPYDSIWFEGWATRLGVKYFR